MPSTSIFKAILCILSFSLFFLPSAQEAKPAENSKIPTLAVNNLTAHGLTEAEALTLTDVLRSRLMETKKYKVMERSEMETILKEQAFQNSGACTEEACIVEMGQLLGIEQVLAGSIGQVGKAYSINVRIISVQSGEILKSVSHNYTGPIENLLTSEMTVVAKKIAGIQMEIVKPPETESAPVKKNNNKLRRRVIISSVAILAVGGGGAAAFLLIKQGEKSEEPTATVGVEWNF